MPSLADLPELTGFFSYAREDDDDSEGALSQLRDRIQRELRGQLGRSRLGLKLWQDKQAIAHGTQWEEEIKSAVAQSVFFVPIVTPTAVKSRYCKLELEAFLAREAELRRADLIFPILYIRIPELEDERQWRNDDILKVISARQYLDWLALRHLDIGSTKARTSIEQFCRNISAALQKPRMPDDGVSVRPVQEPRLANERPAASGPLVNRDIHFSAAALQDCRTSKTELATIRAFIAEEFVRHPAIFRRPFSSFPLIFFGRLILLSWDGRGASVERLLQRRADPSLEAWVQCLTLYRRATLLAYRRAHHDVLLEHRESAQTIKLYWRLLASVRTFMARDKETGANRDEVLIPLLGGLFEDANIALEAGDLSGAITHLETLLSSVHKLLLHHAPQPREAAGAEDKIGDAAVLVIDDERPAREMVEDYLKMVGISVHAVGSAEEALKALVDKKFEILWIDVNMPGMTGDTLMRLAKKIDPSIKIMLATAVGLEHIPAEDHELIDAFFQKPFHLRETVKAIAKLRSGSVYP